MNAAAPMAAPRDRTIEMINDTLRGQVMDILHGAIPQLKQIERRNAYEAVMNSPELTARCFQEFRTRPELFRALMVGPDFRPVESEDHPLSCGRSLAQIVALVVRAVARRHFRRRLVPKKQVAAKPKPKPLLFRIQSFLRLTEPPPKPRTRKLTAAEALYQALRDFLLYEWQLPLIPHYADLPVPLVRALGARILDFREIAEVRELARTGLVPPVVVRPVVESNEGKATGQGQAIPQGPGAAGGSAPSLPAWNGRPAEKPITGSPAERAETIWALSQSLALPALLRCDENQMRRIISTASAIGPKSTQAIADAGLRPREATVVLVTLANRMGHSRVTRFLGPEPHERFLEQFAGLLRDQAVGAMRLPANVMETVEDILDRLKVPPKGR